MIPLLSGMISRVLEECFLSIHHAEKAVVGAGKVNHLGVDHIFYAGLVLVEKSIQGTRKNPKQG